MQKYDPKSIEAKWQSYWEENKTFSTPKDSAQENKFYVLPQLPYPSGSGLHVGHAEVYTACDIYARYQRMKGKTVLQVFGLDSFGLPAENYAIKTNVHPKQTIDETGANFVEQVKKLGASVDWDRFVSVFVSERWEGKPAESEEMAPEWFALDKIPYEKMWVDDTFWLPQVLAGKTINAAFHFSNDGSEILNQKIDIVT